MAVHQLLSGFLVNGHLSRVSRQLRLSNEKSDNEVKPVTVLRFPDIYVKAEGDLGKPQLGLQLTPIGLHRERGERKQMKKMLGRLILYPESKT